LRQIPNVGASIAAKIDEYLRTRAIHQLEELRAKVPAGVRRLTTIPTLGPKKAMALYDELSIDSVDALAEAIRGGKLAGLRGFGARTEQNLLHGIELLHKAGQRVCLDVAMDLAEEIIAALSSVPGCQRVTYAGSLRRTSTSSATPARGSSAGAHPSTPTGTPCSPPAPAPAPRSRSTPSPIAWTSPRA
jgi:DNA polymerase (family X)